MQSQPESDFIKTPSTARSVRTSDGRIMQLDEELWEASPVLRNQQLIVTLPSSSLEALLSARRNGIPAEDQTTARNLLAATCELELFEMTFQCAEASSGMKTFVESDFPSQWSTETVMHCFKMLLDGPMRTRDIYKKQLTRIAKHCDNDRDVMTKALDYVKHAVAKVIDLRLEGMPVNFDTRFVPIVIYNRQGFLTTAIYDGEHLEPVDVLGTHFKMEELSIEDSFYLKYGSYILYKSGRNVYQKNLRESTDAVRVLDGCTHLSTRGKYVFAVQVDSTGRNTVHRWLADRQFVQVHETPLEIRGIDFDYDERELAMLTGRDHVLLFKLSDDNRLILLAERTIPVYVRQMIYREKRISVVADRFYPKFNEHLPMVQAYNFEEHENSMKRAFQLFLSKDYPVLVVSLKQAAGELFVDQDGSLRTLTVVPGTSYSLETILPEGEEYAFSELAMFN